jgi:diacylglycerol kinase family enzyme
MLNVDTTTMPEHQKYLVLINPASGSGKAKAVYYDHVHPMLQEAEAEAIVIVTGNVTL